MADGRIIIDTEIDNSGAEKDIKGLSSKLGSLAKTGAVAITGLIAAASASVATFAGLAVKQYAEYEQLVGGVETLFKDSSKLVQRYAANAFETAGLSANEYMSTITGFSASLLQGLGGDTKKAAEIGNKAVTDMSDNANKMGTAMEMIQNAYQGFAKQNYTMLDNLKLGYGGTKEEMQRLLVDAGKLSGMEYSIGNFSDIIEAIHVIQTELGITGTTALEASTTIEGSFNMLKSAWANILTGMASDTENFDDLVNDLVYSLQTFGGNVLPRIKIAINGITKLFNSLVQELPSLVNSVLPELVSSGIDIIKNLISGIQASLPLLLNTALGIIMSLVNGVIEVMPMLLEVGLQALMTLGQGIAANLPTLIPIVIQMIIGLCDMIVANLPMIIDVAIDIILALVQGLVNALPTLIAEVPRIINSFANAIYSALPQILKAGIDILLMLIKGLIDSIPILIANIPQIIMAIVNVITLYNWASLGKSVINWLSNGISSMKGSIGNIAKGVAEWVGTTIKNIFSGGLSWGKGLISSIGQGFSSMVSYLGSSARSVATGALNAIKSAFTGGFDIGKNLIQGIWNGISNMSGWIINLIGGFASSVIGSIKSFFGIHSPSRVMRDLIGVNLVKGIGVGVDVETPNLEKDINDNMADLTAKMKGTVDYETARTSTVVAAKNTYKESNSADNPGTNGISEGSIFILKNDIDGKSLGETVYKVVDGKLAIASRRKRG